MALPTKIACVATVLFFIGNTIARAADCSVLSDGMNKMTMLTDKLNQRITVLKTVANPNYRDAEICAIATQLRNVSIQIKSETAQACINPQAGTIEEFRKHWDDVIEDYNDLTATTCIEK